jgi:hypothetical protein
MQQGASCLEPPQVCITGTRIKEICKGTLGSERSLKETFYADSFVLVKNFRIRHSVAGGRPVLERARDRGAKKTVCLVRCLQEGGGGSQAGGAIAGPVWPGQARPGQVRSGQARSGQVSSGQVRLGQVRSGQVRSSQVRSGQVRSSQVMSGQVRPDQARSGQVRSVRSDGEMFTH